MSPHLGVLLAYSAVLVLVGLWMGRRVRGSGDFFVAGRRLSAPLLCSTVLAANIGAGSTVGATSLGYRDGLGAWWWNGSAALGTLALALWIGPRIRREAARRGFYTVGDFLEQQYGGAVRAIIAALIWLGAIFILAGQLIGGAAILSVAAGLPRALGCLISGVVMTSYFVAGGLLGTARVNVVELVVILTGFVVAVPLVAAPFGGWSALAATPGLPEHHLSFWYSTGPGSGWTFLALLTPAFAISPGLVQKAYAAASERTVRIGIAASSVMLMLFAFAPALLGIATRARHPDLASPDLALPTILVGELPLWIGSLALAAVFSAEVSSADAVLFMLSTSLSQDFYRRFINPAAGDAQILRVARWAAVAGGALGTAIAIVVPTVVAALTIFYTLLGVSLFVPLVAGLYRRPGGTPEALASIAAAIAVLVVAEFGTGGRGVGPLTPNLLALVAAMVAFGLVHVARSTSVRRGRRAWN